MIYFIEQVPSGAFKTDKSLFKRQLLALFIHRFASEKCFWSHDFVFEICYVYVIENNQHLLFQTLESQYARSAMCSKLQTR